MRGVATIQVLKKRPKLSPYPGEGYRRAKRSVRPWPLKVGLGVVYEDKRGRVHRRRFEVVALTRTMAIIKGWPDRVVRRGPMKRFAVPKTALVDVHHVMSEEFKAAFGVPEDRPGICYDAAYFDMTHTRRRRKKVTDGRQAR